MSLVGRFRYRFKKNTPKWMSLACTIDNCPWKITWRELGATNVIQVHTFENTHNHSLDDVASLQHTIRANRASMVIDDVIHSTLEYQPCQICKDFVKQHGLRLMYNQAWHLKEKKKEFIYGIPKYYYKLLSWMCERIVQTNPGFVVKLTHSSDGNFQQPFIAHEISIPGFGMGCRPIKAIDSSHMSRPYGGVLLLATTYDPNDCMSLLACGIMSLKNYEDWSWFLEKLKTIFEEKEVVIISNRHPALLWSVLEIFGAENHAYYYRHLKENFSMVVTKHNTRGNKGKECVLQCLNSIAY